MNELDEARPCAYCGTLIGRDQGLCSTCLLGVSKYPAQNDVIIRAWVAAGLEQLAAYLERDAAFKTWLVLHDQARRHT